jgi:putative ABC transport system permease protein
MGIAPIIRLSWKNVWRNPMRSGVVVAAVVIGTWAGIFVSAFMAGITSDYVSSQLDHYTGHLRVQDARFAGEALPAYAIDRADSLLAVWSARPEVAAVSPRSVVNALAGSASASFGVRVTGVDPDAEARVFRLPQRLTQGAFLPDDARNAAFMGEKLAARLRLTVGSRVVLTFQDADGNLTAGAFRIRGLFKSPNPAFDERNVIVRRTDLNRLIGLEGAVHEVAFSLIDLRTADSVAVRLAAPGLDVRSWGDLSPALRYSDASMETSLGIFMGIIILALAFGIINTMLMAVLERTPELGMMMAIGVDKFRTGLMIVMETVFLSLVGTPLGMVLAWVTVTVTAGTGIDLGAFAQGFEMYGMNPVIRPVLPVSYYALIAAMMAAATLVSSVFPTIRALRLNPVTAIRST